MHMGFEAVDYAGATVDDGEDEGDEDEEATGVELDEGTEGAVQARVQGSALGVVHDRNTLQQPTISLGPPRG